MAQQALVIYVDGGHTATEVLDAMERHSRATSNDDLPTGVAPEDAERYRAARAALGDGAIPPDGMALMEAPMGVIPG